MLKYFSVSLCLRGEYSRDCVWSRLKEIRIFIHRFPQMSTEEKPEEKFKLLINIGIGLSALLIAGIIVTIGITASNPGDEPDEYAMQRYRDSMMAANAVVEAYDYDYYYNDPGDRYDYGPGPTERENDSLNKALRGTTYSYQQDLLDHLDDESDNCARQIHELIVAFQDTLKKPGVSYTATTSISFFGNTSRDEELFSALFSYRELSEEYAEDAGLYDYISYRTYFPLLEKSDYAYIKSWDKTEFEKDPDSVINYLERMEMDLRYYENQMLWDLTY